MDYCRPESHPRSIGRVHRTDGRSSVLGSSLPQGSLATSAAAVAGFLLFNSPDPSLSFTAGPESRLNFTPCVFHREQEAEHELNRIGAAILCLLALLHREPFAILAQERIAASNIPPRLERLQQPGPRDLVSAPAPRQEVPLLAYTREPLVIDQYFTSMRLGRRRRERNAPESSHSSSE